MRRLYVTKRSHVNQSYARVIRAFAVAALAAALVAGCGGSGATEPFGGGASAVRGSPSAPGTALVERVAVGAHDGFDRVVFEFQNHLPGYRVEYARPPFFEDGSGARVDVGGHDFVAVRIEPASGFDASAGGGRLVYTGPKRIEGADAGADVVRELARTGDFEGVVSWVIGLDDRVDFRVLRLDGPPRLVIDFRTD
jgi:hypothetical protein